MSAPFKVGDIVKVVGKKSSAAGRLHGKTCTVTEVHKRYVHVDIEGVTGRGGLWFEDIELVEAAPKRGKKKKQEEPVKSTFWDT